MSRIGNLLKNIFVQTDDIEGKMDIDSQQELINSFADETEEVKKELIESLIYIDKNQVLNTSENKVKREIEEENKKFVKNVKVKSVKDIAEIAEKIENVEKENDSRE